MFGGTPLSLAIECQKINHATSLLQFHCNINPLPHIASPSRHAVQHNNHKVLKCILKMDIKTELVDEEQMGILHIAGTAGDFETISILLNYETPISISPASVDINGNTPMGAFEIYRPEYIQEHPEQLAKSREAFEALLNKVNEYHLQL